MIRECSRHTIVMRDKDDRILCKLRDEMEQSERNCEDVDNIIRKILPNASETTQPSVLELRHMYLEPEVAPEVAFTAKPGEAPEVECTAESGEAPEVACTAEPGEAPEVACTAEPGEKKGKEEMAKLCMVELCDTSNWIVLCGCRDWYRRIW